LKAFVDTGRRDLHRRREVEMGHQVDERLPPEAIFKERDDAHAHSED
jgi:hypothetical protein